MNHRHASHDDDAKLLLMTAKQLASGLVRAIADAQGLTSDERSRWRINEALIHFHDDSHCGIAWNDVQAIVMYNEVTGQDVPVPLTATEGYNNHFHRSQFDGGFIPGMGPPDHRDNNNGGYCFAIFHPGTNLPQLPWGV